MAKFFETGMNLSNGAYGFTSSSSSAKVVPGSYPGIINAFGSNGTMLRCEYEINPHTRDGIGACASSRGAWWQIHFGTFLTTHAPKQIPQQVPPQQIPQQVPQPEIPQQVQQQPIPQQIQQPQAIAPGTGDSSDIGGIP